MKTIVFGLIIALLLNAAGWAQEEDPIKHRGDGRRETSSLQSYRIVATFIFARNYGTN